LPNLAYKLHAVVRHAFPEFMPPGEDTVEPAFQLRLDAS
jgi:hypothetical protein